MKAIFKREFRAYFTSTIGYIYLAAFFAFSGFLFYSNNIAEKTTSMYSLFTYLFNANFILVPILTMRMYSEDKKQKTDQLLLTSPVTLGGLVGGKFLSAFGMYMCGGVVTLLYALVMSGYSAVPWGTILTSFLGFALAGAALIAIGGFISALTENQIVAVIISFIFNFFYILYFDTLAKAITITPISKAMLGISITQYYANFTIGLIDLPSVLFMLTLTGLFIFFTIRIIDKRRWS